MNSKETLLTILGTTGVLDLFRRRSAGMTRILCYHGVEDVSNPLINHDELQLPPVHFRRHMEIIQEQGYRVVRLEEALTTLIRGVERPHYELVITFDDGFRNNLEQAAPVLKEFGYPAVFFVTTGLVTGERGLWWYRLRQAMDAVAASGSFEMPNGERVTISGLDAQIRLLRRLEVMLKGMNPSSVDRYVNKLEQLAGIAGRPDAVAMMTPEEVGQLAGMGFDVEPHSHRHLSGHAIDVCTAADEITTSASLIQKWTGQTPRFYSYPFGDDYPEKDKLFNEAGFQAAVTSDPDMNRPGISPFALKRWTIKTMHTPARFEALLSGFSDWMRRD